MALGLLCSGKLEYLCRYSLHVVH